MRALEPHIHKLPLLKNVPQAPARQVVCQNVSGRRPSMKFIASNFCDADGSLVIVLSFSYFLHMCTTGSSSPTKYDTCWAIGESECKLRRWKLSRRRDRPSKVLRWWRLRGLQTIRRPASSDAPVKMSLKATESSEAKKSGICRSQEKYRNSIFNISSSSRHEDKSKDRDRGGGSEDH